MALDGVLALDLELDADLRLHHAEMRGLGHIGRGSGNRREDAFHQPRGLAGGAEIGLHHRRGVLAHHQGALAMRDIEGELGAPHADLLAHEIRNLLQRAAELAAEGVEQRLLLRGRSAVIDIAQDGEIALQHVAGDEGGDPEDEPRDVEAVDLAFFDAIGERAAAGAVIRILADPAGAEDVAVADLEEVAFEPIPHLASPRFPGVSEACAAHPRASIRTARRAKRATMGLPCPSALSRRTSIRRPWPSESSPISPWMRTCCRDS